MAHLGVNIDHVATVRQARYRGQDAARSGAEPDPVLAAAEALLGGADIITAHLREDRRHVHDRDVERLRAAPRTRFNLEMGASDEMVAIAERLRPDMCTLVPEGRQEVTTEGGLDVASQAARLADVVARLRAAGAAVSAFIDPDPRQVEAATRAGFGFCEVHTGPYAAAFAARDGDLSGGDGRAAFDAVADAGRRIVAAGMGFNAGHALNYRNVAPIAALPGVRELHIGHSIVSRAVFVGLRAAVREMKDLVRSPSGSRPG